MSLIRQLWLLLIATVLLGVVGSVVVSLGASRDHLQTALRLKNNDNAQALALALSQQRGDATAAELLISAQFDTGFYERIRLTAPDGRVLVERRAQAAAPGAPTWFVRWVPIASDAGVAQVSDGWKPLGSLEVVSAASFAHADLWRGSLRSAAWLLGVGMLLGGLGSLVIGRIRRPLQTTVAQAEALVERRFVTMPEPSVPELRQLSSAMNALVRRLQSIFGEQDAQLEALRHEAQVDRVSGLAQRGHFLAQLGSLLGRGDVPAEGWLILLRLRHLTALNREHGHRAVDAWLQAWSTQLSQQVVGQAGVLVGRLNGSDFVVAAPGPAHELADRAARMLDVMRRPLAGLPPPALALGAIGWTAGSSVGQLMSEADAALAQAESQAQDGPALFVDVPRCEALHVGAVGEGTWRAQLAAALGRGDARLAAYPVVARDGALIHLESPLRLRLQEGAEEVPAARWLAWAVRTRLNADADLLAVRLGLQEIERDGRARAINLAPESLADSRFAASLQELLVAHARPAQSLWLEVGERAAVDRLPLVRELARQCQPFGVKVGLEHAGERLGRIDRLYEAHLDYVKLDRALSLGLGEDARRAEFLRGLVWMLHGLGIAVHAEGVSDAQDAQALWHCGVDGQTGPWVTAQA